LGAAQVQRACDVSSDEAYLTVGGEAAVHEHASGDGDPCCRYRESRRALFAKATAYAAGSRRPAGFVDLAASQHELAIDPQVVCHQPGKA